MKFCKVEFTYICSARETKRKITKILQPFGFELELESFKSVKYSCRYEFSKVGTFFCLTRYVLPFFRKKQDEFKEENSHFHFNYLVNEIFSRF